jgi:hypothetical protein
LKKNNEILQWIAGFIENKKTITEKEVKNIKKRIMTSEKFIVSQIDIEKYHFKYKSDSSIPFDKYNIVYNE